MPWSAKDAEEKTSKADTPAKKKKWSEIANEARRKAIADGKSESEADASAIKIANAAVGNMKESDQSGNGRLQESTIWQSKPVEVVTEDNGETTVLKDVLILGKTSRNRVDYLDEALQTGHRLFESCNSFAGHDRDGRGQGVRDNIGVMRNPRVASDGIHADHAMPTADPLTPKLVWRAKHAPKNIGYSPDFDCHWNLDSKGRKQVYRIDRVLSADVVMRPGTTNGMKEDEESIPTDQQPLAESVLSAGDNLRSIMLADGTLEEKRGRLLEAVLDLHGELIEGEIADELAKDAPRRRMREVADVASRKLDEAMWDSSKYPQHHAKRNRQIAVLKDHLKELSSIECNCPDCGGKSKQQEETSNMEFKDITVETLTKERPDLVAKLTGTDEHGRLTEEVKTTKAQLEAAQAEVTRLQGLEAGRLKEAEIAAELKTAGIDATTASTAPATKGLFGRLREQLLSAADKTIRAAIIQDYKPAFSGRVQEARMPGPMEELRDPNAGQRGTLAPEAKKKYFG